MHPSIVRQLADIDLRGAILRRQLHATTEAPADVHAEIVEFLSQ